MSWELLGHAWAADLLRDQLAHGKQRHAYLITGPTGAGRRTLALRLAQALNCTQPPSPGVSCGACRDCQQIGRMQHPDLAVVQAEREGGTLKVEQVRELQHLLALAPYQARYRVALLLRFEEAHLSAANALLKTLEEPPPQVVLILTASDAESILPTIVSRCDVLRLHPIPTAVLAPSLQTRLGLSTAEAHLLACVSGGRPGVAMRLAEQSEILAQRQSTLETLLEILGARRVQRFGVIEALTQDKEKAKQNIRQMVQAWMPFWEDVLIQASGASAPLSNPDHAETITLLAGQLPLRVIHDTILALSRTIDLLEKNVNTRLAAEVLMLDLPTVPGVRPSG